MASRGNGSGAAGWRGFAALIVVAAIGAAVAFMLNVPAPFLTGPAALVSVLAIAGLPVSVPLRVRDLCFLVIGIGMGSGLTPEAVQAAARWPVPLATLAVALVVLVMGGAVILRRAFGFTPKAAMLGATPGHLSFVIAMAEDLDADVVRVSVVQALRVLYLTLLVPFAVKIVTGADLTALPAGREAMAPLPILALAVAGAAVAVLFLRLRIPAAVLLAGLAVSGAAHAGGLVSGAMPQWLAIPAFVTMGALIGTRFSGVTLRDIGGAALASLTLAAFAIAVTVVAAEAVHAMVGLPRVDLMIAFAPGGLETMAALSLMLGADPAFVALHHLGRLLFLSVLVPALMLRRDG
ncbi:AbrB family transcriptional regulator [Rhodobacterales bacterium HKCCE2091]|nr:AbrB family transcriptional regulator [Rhodobacterales bacterium HKCCE2091]